MVSIIDRSYGRPTGKLEAKQIDLCKVGEWEEI